jgi:hypothetical protein
MNMKNVGAKKVLKGFLRCLFTSFLLRAITIFSLFVVEKKHHTILPIRIGTPNEDLQVENGTIGKKLLLKSQAIDSRPCGAIVSHPPPTWKKR